MSQLSDLTLHPASQATSDACSVCPSLPSSETAFKVVTGQPGSLWLLARDVVVRAGLISIGMAVVNGGYRDDTLKNAFGGSLGIEAFVLGYTWWKNNRQNNP